VQEIVRIHGKWCGPDWTAGQRKPAKDLTQTDRSIKCTDKLDCACKVHDIDVYERGGRTRGSDTRLANVAIRMAFDPRVPRYLRRKALLVAYGMLLGRAPR